ncbi:hypothetical protein CW704_05660, partial [Candidatus Bathyarchaeota archaeon]
RSWSIRDKEWSFYLWLGPRMAGAKEKPELYRYEAAFVPPEPAKYELEKYQPERTVLTEEEKETAEAMEKKLREFIESLSPSPGDLMAKDFMKRQMSLQRPA